MDASGPGVGAQRRPGAATNATRSQFDVKLYCARRIHTVRVNRPCMQVPSSHGHGPTNGQREPSSPYFEPKKKQKKPKMKSENENEMFPSLCVCAPLALRTAQLQQGRGVGDGRNPLALDKRRCLPGTDNSTHCHMIDTVCRSRQVVPAELNFLFSTRALSLRSATLRS